MFITAVLYLSSSYDGLKTRVYMKYALCIHFRCQRQPNHQKKQNGEKKERCQRRRNQRKNPKARYVSETCLFTYFLNSQNCIYLAIHTFLIRTFSFGWILARSYSKKTAYQSLWKKFFWINQSIHSFRLKQTWIATEDLII